LVPSDCTLRLRLVLQLFAVNQHPVGNLLPPSTLKPFSSSLLLRPHICAANSTSSSLVQSPGFVATALVQLEAQLLALAQQPLTYSTNLNIFIGFLLIRSDMATILIVEDDPEISSLLRSFIEEQGHKTFSAATADKALAIVTGPEAVDALFVDIILKGDMQAGIEFAKRAVELKPELKVLYSTGLTVTDDMKALVVPGSIILEKPYSEDQLLTSLTVQFGAGPQPDALD
jgi:CheY-like chemotaxis protein